MFPQAIKGMTQNLAKELFRNNLYMKNLNCPAVILK